jgi:hypothetical protein
LNSLDLPSRMVSVTSGIESPMRRNLYLLGRKFL